MNRLNPIFQQLFSDMGKLGLLPEQEPGSTIKESEPCPPSPESTPVPLYTPRQGSEL